MKRRLTEDEGKSYLDKLRGEKKPKAPKTIVIERFKREPIPDAPKTFVRPKAEYSNPQWQDLLDKILND